MSFNIRYGIAKDGKHHWDRRKKLVAKRIQAFGPDLLGLQECRDDEQAVYIKENLSGYGFYGQRRGGNSDSSLEMAPIFFESSKFQVKATGHFWLGETPNISGSKSWGSHFPRTVTWVKLLDRPTGQTITFVNTHFDLEQMAIDKAARMLRQWLDEIQVGSAIVLTGDFNTNKNSRAYQCLTGNEKLFDAYRMANSDLSNEATFHGYGKAAVQPPIDWILISEHFRVKNAGIDKTREGNLYPSDHYSVWAILEWQEDKRSNPNRM